MNKANGLFTLFIVVVMLTGGVMVHEYTHKYFFDRAGCQSDIQFFTEGDERTPPAVAAVNATCSGTEEELNRLGQRQAMTEAVGYQVLPLYIFLGLLLAVTMTNRGFVCRRCGRKH